MSEKATDSHNTKDPFFILNLTQLLLYESSMLQPYSIILFHPVVYRLSFYTPFIYYNIFSVTTSQKYYEHLPHPRLTGNNNIWVLHGDIIHSWVDGLKSLHLSLYFPGFRNFCSFWIKPLPQIRLETVKWCPVPYFQNEKLQSASYTYGMSVKSLNSSGILEIHTCATGAHLYSILLLFLLFVIRNNCRFTYVSSCWELTGDARVHDL